MPPLSDLQLLNLSTLRQMLRSPRTTMKQPPTADNPLGLDRPTPLPVLLTELTRVRRWVRLEGRWALDRHTPPMDKAPDFFFERGAITADEFKVEGRTVRVWLSVDDTKGSGIYPGAAAYSDPVKPEKPAEKPAEVIHEAAEVTLDPWAKLRERFPDNVGAAKVFRSTSLGGEDDHAARNAEAASPAYRDRARLVGAMHQGEIPEAAAADPGAAWGAEGAWPTGEVNTHAHVAEQERMNREARDTIYHLKDRLREEAGAAAGTGSAAIPAGPTPSEARRKARETFLDDNREAFEDAEFEARTDPSYYGGEERGPERAAAAAAEGWRDLGSGIGKGIAWFGFWIAVATVFVCVAWRG